MDYLYLSSMMFISLASLSLSLFLKAEDDPRINLPWRMVMLANSIWAFGRAMMVIATSKQDAFNAMHIAYTGSIWLAPLWAWLTCEVIKKSIPKWLFLASVLFFSFIAILSFTPYFILELKPKMNFKYYDDSPGLVFNLWSNIFSVYAIWAQYALFREARRSSIGRKKYQCWTLFVSGLVGFGGSATTFPLVKNIEIYPFGVPIIALFPFLMGYALVKFQWMDLYLLLRDSTIQIVSSLVIAAGFMGLATFIHIHWFKYLSPLIMAILLPALYPSINFWVRRRINRTKWGEIDRYLSDIDEKLKPLLESSLSMRSVAETTVELVTSIFPIQSATVYFLDSETKTLQLFSHKNILVESQKSGQGKFDRDHPLYKILTTEPRILIKKDLEAPEQKGTFESVVDVMNKLRLEIIMPLCTSGKLAGFIGIGAKNSSVGFHINDLTAFKKVLEQTQIACSYASVAEKYTVTMRDWAHSLNQITKPMEMSVGQIRLFHDMWPWEKLEKNLDIIDYRIGQLRKVHEFISNSAGLARQVVTGSYNLEKTEIVNLLIEHLKTFAAQVNQANIQFQVDIIKTACEVMVNPTSIIRLVDELLGNAIRHTSPQGSKGIIIVRAYINGDHFEVSIKDNGDGIEKDNIERIWDAGWQQGDMNSGVAGLGLAIAKQIIEAHNGKIWADSAGVGKGSEFIFTLPIFKSKEGK